jgi:hypothetical protein
MEKSSLITNELLDSFRRTLVPVQQVSSHQNACAPAKSKIATGGITGSRMRPDSAGDAWALVAGGVVAAALPVFSCQGTTRTINR